jgi:hypothetical protein
MQTIFSFGHTNEKYAVGSSEPLGTPPVVPSLEDVDSEEFDTVVLYGTTKKPTNAPKNVFLGDRKRGAFTGDEIVAFTHLTSAVKDIMHAIQDNKTTDMHPDL